VILSTADYEFVQRLLLERAAIRISVEQEYLVRSRLEPVAKRAGLSDLTALVEQLRREPYGALHSEVVEAMTTNETSFFRDVHPFETLRNVILPEVIARKGADKTLRIWSAACASGQEPYSLAMLLNETPTLADFRIQIIATDLARPILAKAQQGSYNSLEVGRGLPARLLARYFERVGTAFQVSTQLRSMIEWRQLNLAAPWPPLPIFDIVFIRNVLIYFPQTTIETVLKNIRKTLHPQGYLFLGTTENMLGMSAGFETVTKGKTMFYRPSGPRKG
jgi:chemotaxis protein methyltransferase CheR